MRNLAKKAVFMRFKMFIQLISIKDPLHIYHKAWKQKIFQSVELFAHSTS